MCIYETWMCGFGVSSVRAKMARICTNSIWGLVNILNTPYRSQNTTTINTTTITTTTKAAGIFNN